MLERSDGKLSCCVLRGAGRSNAVGLLGGFRPDLSVSSKGWQSQQGINLPGQKSEPGNLSNSVASDQNIEAY